LQAEILFLRRQLALYRERRVKPKRVDAATRMMLALLSRCFDWRSALFVVRPETLIGWHRAASDFFGDGSLELDSRRFRRNFAN
jgi:hypothetical protein